ncbi:MAG TPA: radical SAM protein, partial [bacterium]|nr:radical SAM protein [bacterium]
FRKTKDIIYLSLLKQAIKNKTSRDFILKKLDQKIYQALMEDQRHLPAIQLRKYQWLKGLITQFFKNLDKGYISPSFFGRVFELLGRRIFFRREVPEIKEARENFKKKYGIYPPLFIVVSPTQKCNLACKGCYAASSPKTWPTLPFDVFDRILKENHDIFGSRFVVISGGEPLLYESQGKNLLDIFEKYSDTFFIFYTNATLITKEVAKRLAELANAIPQISVEGFKEETDARRGQGVFERILEAIENLKKEGVPFVISVTATRENLPLLLEEKFYQFWFDEKGASYMWIFQLMPIGRGKEVFDLMPTPEERVKLYQRWEEMLKKGYPIADFWNSGVLSSGCIAYGREGSGYLYIDWNGYIMPCVFIPYYVDTIYNLYQQGKTLADALFSDFFIKGRKWQLDYGYRCPREAKNWLMPCSIRDHYKYFREIILPEEAKGEDEAASLAKDSIEYFQKLVAYDQELEKLTQPIWEKEYKKTKEN